jgi:hypothetical protein
MAQDGFPIRIRDLTTGNPEVSPYLQKGTLPVITNCPSNCRTTDFGDCECLPSGVYKNSCGPDCYATYGQEDLISGSGSGPLDLKKLDPTCVCPKTQVGSDIVTPIGMDQAEIARAANAQAGINRLLKSTRIHVCSPHTFIVNADRC